MGAFQRDEYRMNVLIPPVSPHALLLWLMRAVNDEKTDAESDAESDAEINTEKIS